MGKQLQSAGRRMRLADDRVPRDELYELLRSIGRRARGLEAWRLTQFVPQMLKEQAFARHVPHSEGDARSEDVFVSCLRKALDRMSSPRARLLAELGLAAHERYHGKTIAERIEVLDHAIRADESWRFGDVEVRLRSLHGFSIESWGTESPAVYRELAQRLRELPSDADRIAEQSPAGGDSNSASDDETHTQLDSRCLAAPYVARPGLDDALSEILNISDEAWRWERRRTVFLYGEPGTGKSRFAREHLGRSGAVFLSADSEEALALSVLRLFDRLGTNRGVVRSSLDVMHRFHQLLAETDIRTTVCIDGIHRDSPWLTQLPRTPRSLIVIVTDKPPANESAPAIRIPELTHDESEAMIHNLSPQLDSIAACRLAFALGGRARVIDQACALLNRERELDAREYALSLLEDIETTLAATEPPSDRALALLYRRMVTDLQHHPSALTLLDYLAFSAHPNTTERCAAAYLAGEAGAVKSAGTRPRLAFLAAVRPLIDLGLVQTGDDRYCLDSLTGRLLRAQRHASARTVATRLIGAALVNDDTLLGVQDLRDLGWSAPDIAAHFAGIFAMFMRVDFTLVATTRMPSHSTGSHPDISPLMNPVVGGIWESLFYVVRLAEIQPSVLGPKGQLGRFGRLPLDHLLLIWKELSAGASGTLPLPPTRELLDVMQSPVSVQDLTAWRGTLGYPPLTGKRAIRDWQLVYALYHVVAARHPVPESTEASHSQPCQPSKVDANDGFHSDTALGHEGESDEPELRCPAAIPERVWLKLSCDEQRNAIEALEAGTAARLSPRGPSGRDLANELHRMVKMTRMTEAIVRRGRHAHAQSDCSC